MPTVKQIEAQIKRESATIKQNIVHHACDTALHILHDSYFFNSNLWPKKGFQKGWGIGCALKDCIYVGVNAYGWNQTPVIGSLRFNIWNTGEKRKQLQVKHIKIMMDLAYKNDLYFENEFKSKLMSDECSFKFTYTPTRSI